MLSRRRFLSFLAAAPIGVPAVIAAVGSPTIVSEKVLAARIGCVGGMTTGGAELFRPATVEMTKRYAKNLVLAPKLGVSLRTLES